ncbi:hypothetical protein Phum_PHUM512390 [Pediculus humanus corporis]|uniref:Uncharacterized protein n=1 Tax=Pediculus humanus subsp. corporis TaxID=121224 RepID=E0VYB0_PEDHC|nr:uncharacterized protein Phum_PHUM512390 [Pediculus humanus corporis]EEB18366.1 hypothetical protein Phum_PHUM512390 [Pediculus humanus corporis]
MNGFLGKKKTTEDIQLENMEDVFIPVFWTENSVSLSDEYTNGVKIMLKIVEFGPFVYYGLFILGCLIILGVILLHVFHYKIPRDEKKRNMNGFLGKKKTTEDIQLENMEGKTIKEVKYKFSEIPM